MIGCYVTWRMKWMDWHSWTGDALLALVLFRLLWAFFGSETARFSAFLASPRAASALSRPVLRREPDRQIGHNPVGGWMVLLLLALLLAEAVTGLYVANDVADEGPLTEIVPSVVANLITDLHSYFWDALLAATVLHVLAILLYAAVIRHDLVTPMITGCKTLPQTENHRSWQAPHAPRFSWAAARWPRPRSQLTCEARSALGRHDLAADFAARMRLRVHVYVPLAGGELLCLLRR